jgi:hypothetical protein
MADLNSRRRWRGPPLGGRLQHGCRFCFAGNGGEATTSRLAEWLRPELVYAGRRPIAVQMVNHARWRSGGDAKLTSFGLPKCEVAHTSPQMKSCRLTGHGRQSGNGDGRPAQLAWLRESLAISRPRTEAAVIRHFQERMPYGLVPDVDVA